MERSLPSARSADKDFCMHRRAELIVHYQEGACAAITFPFAEFATLQQPLALRRAVDRISTHWYMSAILVLWYGSRWIEENM